MRAAGCLFSIVCAGALLFGCDWMDNPDIPPPDRDLATDPDVIVLDTVVATDGEDVEVDEPEAAVECDDTLGTWEPVHTRAGLDTDFNQAWKMEGTVEGDFTSSPLFELNIESWYASGGPTTPGTYTIDGWVNALTCGLCVYYFEECTDPESSSTCTRIYSATRAVVDMQDLDPSLGGRVSGTLSDLYMVQVHFGSGEQIPGGLSFCLDLWEFDETFTAISSW